MSDDKEDEVHFVLICPVYNDFRSVYISRYFTVNPSVYKFIQLLNSDRRSVLRKLAIFCIVAFKRRDSVINS